MATSNKRRPPRCSICGKTGHNARTCSGKAESGSKKEAVSVLLVKDAEGKNKKEEVSQKQKNTATGTVLIKVHESDYCSPHVINLKDEKREEIWNSVHAYKEARGRGLEKRLRVDFAGMVKQANRKKITQTKASVKQGKIYIRKPLLSKSKQDSQSVFKIPDLSKSCRFFGKKSKPSLSRGITLIGNRFKVIARKWRQSVHGWRRTFDYKKLAYSSVAMLLIFCLPFPAIGYYHKVKQNSEKIVSGSTDAFLALQSSTVAAMSSDLRQAENDLNIALRSFKEVESIMEREHQVLLYVTSLLPELGKQVTSRQYLLTAGHHLALGNSYLVKGIDSAKMAEGLAFTERMEILRDHLRSARPQYQAALQDLGQVHSSSLPAEFQQPFAEFKLLFAAFIDDMADMEQLLTGLNAVLGDDHLKRYLIVFQNSHEIRPTGGFMGSYAVLDLQKGKIINLEVPGGGSYDLQGQLDQYVVPPLPLQLTNGRWEFQDANWFAHFPASAEKTQWFYEHSRQSTLDGVIALNASVLERLLSVLGPVDMGSENESLSRQDAVEKLQYEVEINYDKELNKPKQVIGDTLENILGTLAQADSYDLMKLLNQMYSALKEKEIQVYFNDTNLQNRFARFGWTGEIKRTAPEQDYLMVVSANLQGQKSDAKIEQSIEHQAVVQPDGTVINTVFIKRKHNGRPGEIFYGAPNISYTRVYVPKGSRLIDAGGFVYPPEEAFHVAEDWYGQDSDLDKLVREVGMDSKTGTVITEEFDKTAFGNWMIVGPGEKAEIYFSYQLPFNIFEQNDVDYPAWQNMLIGDQGEFSKYSLLIQKQSGVNSNFSSSVIYPQQWQPVWESSRDLDLALNGATMQTDLKTDCVFGVIMKKQSSN